MLLARIISRVSESNAQLAVPSRTAALMLGSPERNISAMRR